MTDIMRDLTDLFRTPGLPPNLPAVRSAAARVGAAPVAPAGPEGQPGAGWGTPAGSWLYRWACWNPPRRSATGGVGLLSGRLGPGGRPARHIRPTRVVASHAALVSRPHPPSSPSPTAGKPRSSGLFIVSVAFDGGYGRNIPTEPMKCRIDQGRGAVRGRRRRPGRGGTRRRPGRLGCAARPRGRAETPGQTGRVAAGPGLPRRSTSRTSRRSGPARAR